MKKLLIAGVALAAAITAAPATAQNVSGGVTITLGTPGYNQYGYNNRYYNPYQYRVNPYTHNPYQYRYDRYSQYRYNPYQYRYNQYQYNPYTNRGYRGPVTRLPNGLYLCYKNRNRTGILVDRYTGRPVYSPYQLAQSYRLRCR